MEHFYISYKISGFHPIILLLFSDFYIICIKILFSVVIHSYIRVIIKLFHVFYFHLFYIFRRTLPVIQQNHMFIQNTKSYLVLYLNPGLSIG